MQPNFTSELYEIIITVNKNAVRLVDCHVWNVHYCVHVETPQVEEEADYSEYDEPQLVDISKEAPVTMKEEALPLVQMVPPNLPVSIVVHTALLAICI